MCIALKLVIGKTEVYVSVDLFQIFPESAHFSAGRGKAMSKAGQREQQLCRGQIRELLSAHRKQVDG